MDNPVFRAPLHFRILTVVGGSVAVAGAFFATTRASQFGPGNIVAFIVFSGFVATVGYRQFKLAVIARGDELVVRNYLTTRRIPRDHIRGFDRGRPSMGRGATVRVDVGMSSVAIDALATWPGTRFATSRCDEALAVLVDWADLR